MEWTYNESRKRILINPPKQRLRVTGHRIGTILGLDSWSTPFQSWCEITRLCKAPFEETKYTKAGKAIEPKIIEYVGTKYPNVKSIEEYYGNNFEEYRWNNFKDDSNIFGGVIDAVSTRNDGKTIAMICECKTSSKANEWTNGNVPITYLLQGALYAYLKKLDTVLFACSFLEPMDYNNPENFKVTPDNTILVVKRLSDILVPVDGKYLNIEQCIQYCEEWWADYIDTGISPEFDEEKDKEYLKIIRQSKLSEDNELDDVCEYALNLAKEIETLKISSGIKDKEKELKKIESDIKQQMLDKDIRKSGGYTLKESIETIFNKDMFKEHNPKLYEKYSEQKIKYTLNKNTKEEEK